MTDQTVVEIPKPKGPPQPARPSYRVHEPLTTRVVTAAELPQFVEPWTALAKNVVVTNPFYEPWTLLPALQHLGGTEQLRFLLVFGPAAKDGSQPLWGFFPLEIQSKCLQLPIRTLAFWQHRYCFLAVPLIETNHVREVLEAFWRWFEKNPLRCHVLDTNYLMGEGRFYAAWSDFAIGRSSMLLNEHPRAFQKPDQTFDSYIADVIPADRRNENRRKARRLGETGEVMFHQPQTLAEVDAWVEQFLQLEAAGWKGTSEGNAIARDAADATYLREVMRTGFEQNQLALFSLSVGGKTIAMRSVFLSSNEGFAFKSTYDESYSKFSPGLLLVIEHGRRLFDDKVIRELDTCTAPRHTLHNATCRERRMIQRSLFSDGSQRGDLWLSLIPPVRWLKRQLRPTAGPSYLQISTRQTPAKQLPKKGAA